MGLWVGWLGGFLGLVGAQRWLGGGSATPRWLVGTPRVVSLPAAGCGGTEVSAWCYAAVMAGGGPGFWGIRRGGWGVPGVGGGSAMVGWGFCYATLVGGDPEGCELAGRWLWGHRGFGLVLCRGDGRGRAEVLGWDGERFRARFFDAIPGNIEVELAIGSRSAVSSPWPAIFLGVFDLV